MPDPGPSYIDYHGHEAAIVLRREHQVAGREVAMNDLHIVHATDKFAYEHEPGLGIEVSVARLARIECPVDIFRGKRIGDKLAQIPRILDARRSLAFKVGNGRRCGNAVPKHGAGITEVAQTLAGSKSVGEPFDAFYAVQLHRNLTVHKARILNIPQSIAGIPQHPRFG